MGPAEANFGALLRRLRIEQQLSQESLAERARMSAAAISALERGSRRAPYRASVDLLADGLGVDAVIRRRLHELAQPRRKARKEREPSRTGRSAGALPVWLNEFVGREGEIAQLTALLKKRRLVTATGTGGVGKTRLAATVAEHLAGDYQDAVYFIELAQASEGRQAAVMLANAVGLASTTQLSVVDDLCARLRTSRALIVLDNCEHLSDAVARLATALLSNCTKLRLLATSREPLHVTGEAVFVVSPLEWRRAPDSAELSAAARLFTERARDAGWTPVSNSGSAIDALCRALDGLPLALELAAAHTRTLSPAQILDALHRRLEFLADVGTHRVPRHRTIKATIEWSYALLSSQQQSLFRALAVFPASWPLEALQSFHHVASDGSAVQLHESLVDSSLITVVPHRGTYRYAYLETIRAYALDALTSAPDSPSEYHQALEAMTAYASSVVRRCSAGIGRRHELRYLQELDVEYPAIRAAVAYACDRPSLVGTSHELVQSLREYWVMRGALAEGMQTASKVMNAPSSGVTDDVQDSTRLTLGTLLRFSGRTAEAAALDGVVLQRAQARGADRVMADALTNCAHDEYDLGNINEALALYYRAATTLRQFGDSVQLVKVLHSAATVAIMLGRFADATAQLTEARRIANRIGDERGLSWIAYRRGFLAMVQGDWRTAERHVMQSFRFRQRTDDKQGTASCLEALGIIKTAQGNYAEAARALRWCLEVSKRHGFSLRLIEIAERSAHLAFLQGHEEPALALFARAAERRAELRTPMEPQAAAEMSAMVARANESPVETASDSLDDMVEETLALLDSLPS